MISMWARQKNSGFTIVELLIVIVVIAILAAITIVAYNGIQQRARNAQTASTVQAYKKALIQYAVEQQTYPVTGGNACLGDDYPETGSYTVTNGRICFRSNSTAGLNNSSFNTAIKPYLSNKTPTPNNIIFGNGSNPWSLRGAIFMGATALTINGIANPWVLAYSIEGQNQCPVGPVLDLTGYPNISSASPSTGYSVLISGGTVGVECWLAMPDPTKT